MEFSSVVAQHTLHTLHALHSLSNSESVGAESGAEI